MGRRRRARPSGPLPPSIFIVGDRKQSIYGFRDADVSVLREAARHLDGLRPDGDVRRSISRSFRAVPPLLAFVNDVCNDIDKAPERATRFEYEETDRFPVGCRRPAHRWWRLRRRACRHARGVRGDHRRGDCAAARVGYDRSRPRHRRAPRPIRPGDIAILFRTRESHREFEAALERRGIRSYVYKGLGFFDADEIKDVLALLWYLADPVSDLRAAAFMRSRLFGLSDEALRLLAPGLSSALRAAIPPSAMAATRRVRHACAR